MKKETAKDTKAAGIQSEVSPTGLGYEPTVYSNEVASGARQIQQELDEHNAVSPELAAGDIDAKWQEAESSGDEMPGGHAPTPGQNSVDGIGRAFGIVFQDNQELHTHDEVLEKRDEHRWELDRRSEEE